MKRNRLFILFLFLFVSFLTGCSKSYNSSEAVGLGDALIDKVVLEKNHENYDEVIALYFKGDNITRVEAREAYNNEDELSKAYKTYSESSDYGNLRSSGLNIGYEYSGALLYNTFDGIRGKENILSVLQNDRGYVLK